MGEKTVERLERVLDPRHDEHETIEMRLDRIEAAWATGVSERRRCGIWS